MPPETAPSQPIQPPAPDAYPVDFVCEADVRVAIVKGSKIFIHAKTIVTPSARDLAAPGDILVLV